MTIVMYAIEDPKGIILPSSLSTSSDEVHMMLKALNDSSFYTDPVGYKCADYKVVPVVISKISKHNAESPVNGCLVPFIGSYVEADHPITVANPTKAFRVHEVRIESDRAYVRGINTIWFHVDLVKAASAENAIEAEEYENTQELKGVKNDR